MRKFSALFEMHENFSTSLENIESVRKQSTERDPFQNFHDNIEILKKISFERTQKDLKLIAMMLKQFSYFSKLANPAVESNLLELAKTVKYDYFNRDAVVFHKEDINDRIYLVLEGTAIIFHEVALDVFKSQISVAEDPNAQRTEEKNESGMNTQFSPFAARRDQLKRQTSLFQPRLSRKKVLRLTTFSEATSPLDLRPPSMIPPTPEEKNIRHSPTINSNFAPQSVNPDTISPVPGQEFLDPNANLMDKKKMASYKLLQRADKERPGKYILDGRMLFEMREKLEKGYNFGEPNSKASRAKDVTAMALKGSHLISFSVRDYTKLFDQSPFKGSFAEFYRPYFPETSFDKLAKIANLFEECHFRRNNIIYEEDNEVDGLYVIKEGQVQLQKRVDFEKLLKDDDEPLSPTFKRGYYIASLGPREIFGEDELLFKEKLREHTVTVTSGTATLLKLKAEVYRKMNQTFKELFVSMKKAARTKKSFYTEQRENTIQQLSHSIQQNDNFLKSENPAKKERFEEKPKEWNFRLLDEKKSGLYTYYLKKKEEETNNSSHSRSPNGGGNNKNLNNWLGLVQSVVTAQKKMIDLGLGMKPPSEKPRTAVTSPKVNRMVARSPNQSDIKVIPSWNQPPALERHKTPVIDSRGNERCATADSHKRLVPFFKSLESDIQAYIGAPLVDDKSSLYRKARGYVKRANLQSSPVNQKISSIGLDPSEINKVEVKKLLQRLAKPKNNQQSAEEQQQGQRKLILTRNMHLNKTQSTECLHSRIGTTSSSKYRLSRRSRLDSNLSNSNILEQSIQNTSKMNISRKGLLPQTPNVGEKRPVTSSEGGVLLETSTSDSHSRTRFNNIHISAILEKASFGSTAKGGGFRSTLKRTNQIIDSTKRTNKSSALDQSNMMEISSVLPSNKSALKQEK